MRIRQPPAVLAEQNAVIGFQLDQTGGQFERLWRAAGKVDELVISTAPVILGAAVIFTGSYYSLSREAARK